MNNATKPTNQHTVPQVYLRQFAFGRHLHVYRAGRTAPELRAIKDIAAFPNFYTVANADGTLDDDRELQLSRIENKYRGLFKKVRSHASLTIEEHVDLGLLAAFQEARSTAQRDKWKDTIEHLTTVAEDITRKNLPNATDAEIKQRMRSFVLENIVDGDLDHSPENLAGVVAFGATRDHHMILTHMHLCILESTAHHFFTSLQPVAWLDPLDWPPALMRDYPALRLTMEVTFPLGKRHCALWSWLPMPARAEANAEVVHTINARTVSWSHGEVYTTPTDIWGERQRILNELRAVRDIARRPLTKAYATIGGDTRLFQAAGALGLDLREVRDANVEIVRGWRDAGFQIVPLPTDAQLRKAN